ncbi:Endolytic peptidoglycan transglycosylase RlpA [Methylobacterium oxalidis]|nr:Endolytic peptidoglycan transglycosylase RlpA [Methylobacterium oxalidis]
MSMKCRGHRYCPPPSLSRAALIVVLGVVHGSALAEDLAGTGAGGRFDLPERPAPLFTLPQIIALLPPLPEPPSEAAQATGSVAAPAGRGETRAAGELPRGRHLALRRGAPLGSGRATWYQHPGRTASGERYDPDGLTAAHASLPFGSRVRVVNRSNNRSVVVRITDRINVRTKAKRSYVIDLSRGSARALGISGVAQVALYRADAPQDP